MYLPKPQRQCDCHVNDPPPWTGEVHGLSQALMSKTLPMRAFWWIVIVICISLGATTTFLVVLEYVQGPTATSTTIRWMESMEFPAITICPKTPDSFNITGITNDVFDSVPGISEEVAYDLVEFFVAGSGLENMNDVSYFNRTYLSHLNNLYKIWSEGYTVEGFFEIIQQRYGYKCEDLFYECTLAGKVMDCCNDLMVKRVVMRRGLCYQTKAGLNQTEADEIGKMAFSMKAPSSFTTKNYNYTQAQLIAYVTDNYDVVTEFPRYYIYRNEWTRMKFTARYIELIKSKDVCTDKIFGRDSMCMVRKWLLSNIVIPFNCTLPYLDGVVTKLPPINGVCDPNIIADDYLNKIQYIYNSAAVNEECTPGCRRWDYQTSVQQSQTLTPFEDYTFNLEVSFSDLQYEYVKEIYTTSVPGFMSQIGGQFGFFLGLSIITFIQMLLYGIHGAIMFLKNHIQRKFPFCKVHPSDNYPTTTVITNSNTNYPPEKTISKEHIATLSQRVITTLPPSPTSTTVDSVDYPPPWGSRNLDNQRINPMLYKSD